MVTKQQRHHTVFIRRNIGRPLRNIDYGLLLLYPKSLISLAAAVEKDKKFA